MPADLPTHGAHWFAAGFMPIWLARALPPGEGPAPVIESLGTPDAPATTLTQARSVFTFAHLHLATGMAGFLQPARRVYRHMVTALRDADGGFRQSVAPDGGLRRSYDQSFALLALATLHKADPALVTIADIDRCWDFIATHLTEPDGSLWEDDRARSTHGLRAQNPHMHMLEAVLQCHEMTGHPVWLDRAQVFVDLAARCFIDPQTGAVREFVGPDLSPLTCAAGQRREPGHQYEWAWLLRRYAGMRGDPAPRVLAAQMQRFVAAFGLSTKGPLAGAPFDALDAAGRVTEASHLLWPLTEAGKWHAALYRDSGDPAARAAALRCERLIFGHYVRPENAPRWVNQLDPQGEVLWDAALSRLLYHIALFVTEGQSAGLWRHAPA